MSYGSPVLKMLTYLTDSTHTKHNFELHRTAACEKVSRGGFATSSAHPVGIAPCRKCALGHMGGERTYCHVKSPSRRGIHPAQHPSPAQSLNTFW